MIFEIGKTYKHTTGKKMTIIGRLKTHNYGECLIGEELNTGELLPVGEQEDNAVNWVESEEAKRNCQCEDAISRQEAVEAFQMFREYESNRSNKGWVNRIETVLNQLPPVNLMLDTKKQEICEYCHENSDGYIIPLEKNSHAFIRFDMNGWELSLHAKGWNGSAKIKYCPMCGRELKNG